MTIQEVSEAMVRVYQKIQDCIRKDIPCDDLRAEYDRLNHEWNRLYRFI